MDRVPLPLGPGRVLLPPRHRRRPREGRRGRADRLVPPQSPGPRPRRGVNSGAQREDRRLGRRGRGPADRRPGADRRGVPRGRAAAAGPAAGRAVRDGPVAVSAGRPVRPGHGPQQPLLGAGAADRPPGPGPAARLGPGHLRRAHGSRPARAVARHGRRPPGPGPLPGGAGPQARRAARRHRAGAGPGGREVHPRPRRLVGGRPQGTATPPAPGR